MLRSVLSIFILIISQTSVVGGWNYLDTETNTAVSVRPQIGDRPVYAMYLDLYNALRERWEVVGEEWDDISHGVLTYDGTEANGSHRYVTVHLTNANLFAAYNHGGISHLPHLSWTVLELLDDRMYEIDEKFVQYWLGDATTNFPMTSGNVDAFFARPDGSGDFPTRLPVCNKAAVMEFTEIGHVTNIVYDGHGSIINGIALSTYQPSISQKIVLAEVRQKTPITGWSVIDNFDNYAF